MFTFSFFFLEENFMHRNVPIKTDHSTSSDKFHPPMGPEPHPQDTSVIQSPHFIPICFLPAEAAEPILLSQELTFLLN